LTVFIVTAEHVVATHAAGTVAAKEKSFTIWREKNATFIIGRIS
jgi:hypothetical protein